MRNRVLQPLANILFRNKEETTKLLDEGIPHNIYVIVKDTDKDGATLAIGVQNKKGEKYTELGPIYAKLDESINIKNVENLFKIEINL